MAAVGFTRNTFQNISVSLNPGGGLFNYQTVDLTTDIIVSGYFNAVAQIISAGQIINATCSDAHELLLITSAAGVVPVTTAKYVPS